MLTGPKKKDFVVLTLDAFNAMEETVQLLSTPQLTQSDCWKESRKIKAGNATVRELKLEQAKPQARIRKQTSRRKGVR